MAEDDFSILYQDIPKTDHTGTGMLDDDSVSDYQPTNYGPPQETKTFSGIPGGLMAVFIGAGIFGAIFLILVPVLFIVSISKGVIDLDLIQIGVASLILIAVGYAGVHNLIFKRSLKIGPDGFELYSRKKRMLRAPWGAIMKVYTQRGENNGPGVLGILTRDGYEIKISGYKIKKDEMIAAYQFMVPFCKHYLITIENDLGW